MQEVLYGEKKGSRGKAGGVPGRREARNTENRACFGGDFGLFLPVSADLARYTGGRLPQNVGLFIQANGEYLLTVSRQTAILAPMVITGSCLLLMFSSRRALYPWLISIFTLVIPYFMLASTVFPG